MLQSSNTVAQVSGYQTIVSSAVTCFLASVRQQRDGTSLNHNNMCVHFSGGCIWGASACSSRGTRARCWHCGSDAVPCSPPQPGNIPLFACTCVLCFSELPSMHWWGLLELYPLMLAYCLCFTQCEFTGSILTVIILKINIFGHFKLAGNYTFAESDIRGSESGGSHFSRSWSSLGAKIKGNWTSIGLLEHISPLIQKAP